MTLHLQGPCLNDAAQSNSSDDKVIRLVFSYLHLLMAQISKQESSHGHHGAPHMEVKYFNVPPREELSETIS